MKMFQFETTIGGEKHAVLGIDPGDSGMPKTDQRLHRIFVIDRSGSMSEYNKLNQALDHASRFAAGLRSGDILSIFWYSGQGQFAPIIIGAKPNEDISRVLDRYRYTVGLTVFSEVLGGLESAINDHKDLVDQTVIDLFTDGNAVPNSWSVADEERRAVAAVRKFVDQVSALNTIGFGPYYNSQFLKALSAETPTGIFVHSSRMSELESLFESNTRAARSLTSHHFDVDAPNATILHVGSESTTGATGEMHLTRLSADRNLVYVVFGKTSKDVTVNGEAVNLKSVDKVSGDERESFFYAYANYLYYQGERRKAIDVIVNNLRDRRLADLATNAFTQDEIGDVQAELRRATLYDHARFTGGRTGPNYLPARNALCVMDIFMMLFDTIEPAYYIPYSQNVGEYKRTGRKASSSENRFTPDFSEEVRAPVTEFVWNEERPNLSLRHTVPGTVKLMDTSAKAAGLPNEFKSFIWRNHTFVVDGNVNIPKAEFLVPKGVFMKLVAKKAPFDDLGITILKIENVDTEYHRVVINLEKLPVLNREYAEADPSPSELLRMVWRQTELAAKLKVAKHFLKTVKTVSVEAKAEGAFAGLNEKQMSVLEEHGVRKDGSYGGILPKVAKADDSDFYEANALKFTVAGFATLPSINEFLAWVEPEKAAEKAAEDAKTDGSKAKPKKPKAINGPGRIMVDYYEKALMPKIDALTDGDNGVHAVDVREMLKKEIAVLNAEASTIDTHLAVAKMGKILTHDGFKGFEKGDKGNDVYKDGDRTLNLQAKKIKVYVDRPIDDLEAEAESGSSSAPGASAPAGQPATA